MLRLQKSVEPDPFAGSRNSDLTGSGYNLTLNAENLPVTEKLIFSDK
jgi:hypothetical protein